MEKQILTRGLLAGAIAGLLALIFAKIFAEPAINAAINYESGRDAAQSALDQHMVSGVASMPGMAESGTTEIFSRTVQSTVGLGFGMVLFGATMGALVAVAYSICLGRVGSIRPSTLAYLTAAAGFLSLFLVPFIKYPASPPSVGNAETIKMRTVLYLTCVVLSILLTIGSVVLARKLKLRLGSHVATLVATAAYATFAVVAMAVLPELGHLAGNADQVVHHATETPLPLVDGQGRIVYPGFPADVLYSFRIASVGTQVVLWSVIGLAFGALVRPLVPYGPMGESTRVEARA
jgi:predicted cobalt transporter CbtA